MSTRESGFRIQSEHKAGTGSSGMMEIDGEPRAGRGSLTPWAVGEEEESTLVAHLALVQRPGLLSRLLQTTYDSESVTAAQMPGLPFTEQRGPTVTVTEQCIPPVLPLSSYVNVIRSRSK